MEQNKALPLGCGWFISTEHQANKGAKQTEQREGTRAARQHRIWPRCTSSRGWKNGNGGVYDQHLGIVTGIFPLQVYGRVLQAIGGLRMDRNKALP